MQEGVEETALACSLLVGLAQHEVRLGDDPHQLARVVEHRQPADSGFHHPARRHLERLVGAHGEDLGGHDVDDSHLNPHP